MNLQISEAICRPRYLFPESEAAGLPNDGYWKERELHYHWIIVKFHDLSLHLKNDSLLLTDCLREIRPGDAMDL
jgi:hypothetical protein